MLSCENGRVHFHIAILEYNYYMILQQDPIVVFTKTFIGGLTANVWTLPSMIHIVGCRGRAMVDLVVMFGHLLPM